MYTSCATSSYMICLAATSTNSLIVTTCFLFQCVFHAIRFLTRLKTLSAAPKPLSVTTLKTQPYKNKPLRTLIDAAAFNIYGHWVQRSEEQNRGALFQCHPKPHETSASISRIRLLSGAENDMWQTSEYCESHSAFRASGRGTGLTHILGIRVSFSGQVIEISLDLIHQVL